MKTTQQGKAYTAQQRQEIIKSLSIYLKLGYSLKKACELAGFQYNTIYTWSQKDPALLIKINAWQSTVSVKARKVLIEKIRKGDVKLSQWWLECMERDSFDVRSQNESNTNEDISEQVHFYIPRNNRECEIS